MGTKFLLIRRATILVGAGSTTFQIQGSLQLHPDDVTSLGVGAEIVVSGCVQLDGVLDLSDQVLEDGQTLSITSESSCLTGQFADISLPSVSSSCMSYSVTSVVVGFFFTRQSDRAMLFLVSVESTCQNANKYSLL